MFGGSSVPLDLAVYKGTLEPNSSQNHYYEPGRWIFGFYPKFKLCRAHIRSDEEV